MLSDFVFPKGTQAGFLFQGRVASNDQAPFSV